MMKHLLGIGALFAVMFLSVGLAAAGPPPDPFASPHMVAVQADAPVLLALSDTKAVDMLERLAAVMDERTSDLTGKSEVRSLDGPCGCGGYLILFDLDGLGDAHNDPPD